MGQVKAQTTQDSTHYSCIASL